MNTAHHIHYSIDGISDQQWERLLESQEANFFQTKEAIQFFQKTGLETFSMVLKKNQEILVVLSGIIQNEKGIKANFSRRAIVYGGPIIAQSVSGKDLEELLKELIRSLGKKAIYIEIRNLNDYSSYHSVFEKAGFTYVPHLNFHVDCRDEAMLQKRMSSSKRRQVKKSLKAGAKIIEAQKEQEVVDFYTILENLYKTKIKTPLPELNFFIELWRIKACVFLLIYYEDEIVGGIVCPVLYGKVIYEWYVCGKDGLISNVYPSVLATWAAMEYAVKHNIPRFDFMGAGKPDEDYGVREFKSKFGGALVEHGRFLCVLQPLLYRIGKTAVNILKNS